MSSPNLLTTLRVETSDERGREQNTERSVPVRRITFTQRIFLCVVSLFLCKGGCQDVMDAVHVVIIFVGWPLGSCS